MTPENIVRDSICAYLTHKKIFVFIHDSVGIYDPKTRGYRKNNSRYRKKGVSDILGILPDGRFLAIEVKANKGRASTEQKLFIEDVKRNGGLAFVAWSINDVNLHMGAYLGLTEENKSN